MQGDLRADQGVQSDAAYGLLLQQLNTVNGCGEPSTRCRDGKQHALRAEDSTIVPPAAVTALLWVRHGMKTDQGQ